MRIIGGEYGGRRIHPPAQMPHTRPTTDIAKEGLFNILQHQIDFTDMKTLDLFGGTGAISYELASRGASDLSIVEKDRTMADFIRKTAASLQLAGLRLFQMDVFQYINQCTESFDFIFAGPPYALAAIDEIPRLVVAKSLLSPGGLFVLEHTPRNAYTGFSLFRNQRNYGTTVFSFFENE